MVAWEELFPCKQLLSPGIAVVVFCPGVKLQGFAASLSGSDLNLGDTRDPAESVPVREQGGISGNQGMSHKFVPSQVSPWVEPHPW